MANLAKKGFGEKSFSEKSFGKNVFSKADSDLSKDTWMLKFSYNVYKLKKNEVEGRCENYADGMEILEGNRISKNCGLSYRLPVKWQVVDIFRYPPKSCFPDASVRALKVELTNNITIYRAFFDETIFVKDAEFRHEFLKYVIGLERP